MTLEDLNRLRFLREEIRRLDEKAEVLRARAERLTPILTGMPSGSHDHDQMAGIIAELVDNARRAKSACAHAGMRGHGTLAGRPAGAAKARHAALLRGRGADVERGGGKNAILL